jgi:NadR type nicotinamide-nucleotide adenylyltransferase
MTVWVLMTAMPVTKGHKALIQFADQYAAGTGQKAVVFVCTQPSEPFSVHRIMAVNQIAKSLNNTSITTRHTEMNQDATSHGFWKMWQDILHSKGAVDGDTYIASEVYGKKLAEHMRGKFMPYDPERSIMNIKATNVRKSLPIFWNDIAPEFSKYLTRRVTIFGAESTGKTTLAKRLGRLNKAYFVPEYARPYLENTVNEITVSSMTDIWHGQQALQDAAQMWEPKPFIVQDTDLFSTVGYWDFPHWQDAIGPAPQQLIADARFSKSDLYLITKSNIPFERDPLRYGGDVREGSDFYWINLCEKYGLNYAVLKGSTESARFQEAVLLMWDNFKEHSAPLKNYVRKHNG